MSGMAIGIPCRFGFYTRPTRPPNLYVNSPNSLPLFSFLVASFNVFKPVKLNSYFSCGIDSHAVLSLIIAAPLRRA